MKSAYVYKTFEMNCKLYSEVQKHVKFTNAPIRWRASCHLVITIVYHVIEDILYINKMAANIPTHVCLSTCITGE